MVALGSTLSSPFVNPVLRVESRLRHVSSALWPVGRELLGIEPSPGASMEGRQLEQGVAHYGVADAAVLLVIGIH